MGKIKRIWKVLSGILVIFTAVCMMFVPEDAFELASFIVAFLLLEKGLISIGYYVSMAHHMVGGKVILYYGVFMFDLGVFAVSVSDQSKAIIILYLTLGHLFAGAVSLIRAVRNKKEGYSKWRSEIALGTIHIIITLACIIFRGSTDMLVYIYCIGLINITVLDMRSALKKSAIVYIQ